MRLCFYSSVWIIFINLSSFLSKSSLRSNLNRTIKLRFLKHKGKLSGIQNGINRQRVVSFTLNSQATEITDFATLEANHADFNEPTLGAIIGNELFYVANSQWEFVNEKAESQSDKLRNPVILRLKL